MFRLIRRRQAALARRWMQPIMVFALLATLELSAQSLLFNEVMSFNDAAVADEEGDHPDWVELFNAGTAAINLAGYGLTDDASAPFKWVFPLRVLPARGFLRVFASGKDRTNSANLHTSFAIRAGGETVRLFRPDGQLAAELAVPALPRDVSFGRQPDGSANLRFFATPTPGASNTSAGFTQVLAPPQFTRAGGFYETPFELALSASEPGTAIYYTLDGSEPTSNSASYTTPFTIRNRANDPNMLSLIQGTSTANQHTDGWFPPNGIVYKSTVVRARAFRSGALPSSIATHTYFVSPGAAQRYMLPVISIATDAYGLFDYTNGIYMLGLIFDQYRAAHPNEPLTGHTPANYTQRGEAWERWAHLEFFEPGGRPGFAQDAKIDIQGQSSRSFRLKSLGVKARGNVPPTDTIVYDLFPGLTKRGDGEPLTRFEHLRLRNSGNDFDYTFFRDALCHQLVRHLPFDSLAYRPAVTFLNGEYWGLLNVREQEDAKYLAAHYHVPEDKIAIVYADGSLIEGKPGDNRPFLDLRAFMETNDLANPTHFDYVQARMDVDNFLLYQAANIYFGNADWPHNNVRAWRLKTAQVEPNAPPGHDGRWRWMLFDVDLGYGHPWSGGYGDNTLAAATSPTGRPGLNAPWSTVMLRSLLKNPQFRAAFINTLADLLNSAFKENRAMAMGDQMQATLAPIMAEHIRRWRTMDDSMTVWSNNVRVLRTFASQRPINVRQHIVAQFGLAGYLSLTVNISHTHRGKIRVNTLVIDQTTPGVTNAPYPWKGTYFRNVPIQVQALPAPGYALAGWSGRPDLRRQDVLEISLTTNTTLTALFEPSPPPHDLSAGPYRLETWSPDSPPGTFPPHLRFEQTMVKDPDLATPMDSDWRLAYGLTNRSRINGLGEDGFAFLNTSDPQDVPGSGYLGAAVLALRTTDVTNVQVGWIGGTVTPNERVYAVRLQYRVEDGPWLDVTDASGQPVEYLRNSIAGHEQILVTTLPAAVAHRDFVRLRWKYYFVSGRSGPRAQLRVDDIYVTAGTSPLPAMFSLVEPGADGSLRLQFNGSPYRTYLLQTSTDLRNWLLVQVCLTDLNGHFEFTSPSLGADRARFFRIVAP